MGLRSAILESRLGSCWKCMSLTAVLLVASVVLTVEAANWEDGAPGGDGFWLLVATIATVVFALLGAAHAVTFVLRRTLWRERPVRDERTQPHRGPKANHLPRTPPSRRIASDGMPRDPEASPHTITVDVSPPQPGHEPREPGADR
ncbi:MAG: hypothetical protein KDC87_19615 [Planctomycetes bacterium]|nr:hypothetical protein [Planctomycetota bacterium]